MPFPVAAALIGGSLLAGYGSQLYSQQKQRELYRYQRGGYERQLRDWHKNVPGRSIRYPEFSYPGHIRALDTGISQSYAASIGSASHMVGTVGSLGYRRSSESYYQSGFNRARSLFGQSTGRSSRYL